MEQLKQQFRNQYPRPQFIRDEWLNLNGLWDFRMSDEDWTSICVPFVYQCEKSGINTNKVCDRVFYKRKFKIPSSWKGKRIILNFGAVDYECKVFINDKLVGFHRGGNIGFSFDITNSLNWNEETIFVDVYDPSSDEMIPRGKQFWLPEPDSIWYRRSTGIWQTVWIEPVSYTYIDSVRFTSDIDKGYIEIDYECKGNIENCLLDFYISLDGKGVYNLSVNNIKSKGKIQINLLSQNIFNNSVHNSGLCWTPESPTLFDIDITLKENNNTLDKISSYFGMRKIETRKDGRIYLNNRPYYQKLILDQGYWQESLMTAPTDQALKIDIEISKKMGFNGCRKHQKAEDPLFLYWADKLGYLVWGEIGSCANFSEQSVEYLCNEWIEAIKRDYNHPSIVAWVTINESWGVPNIATDKQQQALANCLYYVAKSIDNTRLVIGNDGWEMTKTDICAIHNYNHGNPDDIKTHEKFMHDIDTKENLISSIPAFRSIYACGYKHNGEPIMLTEFGGIAACNENNNSWGYTQAKNKEELFVEYKRILDAVSKSSSLYGFCYTQLTDVEQETNGLYTYDRKPKVSPDKIKSINDCINGF